MEHRRLVLDLAVTGEPISGWLVPPDGERQRFEGYLELIAVLEQQRLTEAPGRHASSRAEHPRGGER